MKLLYITFINLNDSPSSGSSVRPIKMKQAFEEIGVELVTIDGINNDFSKRRAAVKKTKGLLKNTRFDGCYIEPPSGPMFYYGDLFVIWLLHNKGIPISIFYRDAYWKYPEYYVDKNQNVIKRIKLSVIKCIQIFQWHFFKKNVDLIYFPSITMAKEFDCQNKDCLPPGSFVPNIKEKESLSDPVQFIFVGGAAKNHGTFLTIDAFKEINKDYIKAKLFYVCPEDQWVQLGIDKEIYKDWLEVVHTSGEENLKGYYSESDVAVLTAPRTFYRDFAVPIKIFEYLSYLKPVLVTNCTETARIVEDNGIGWVAEDNVEAIAKAITYIVSNPEVIAEKRKVMINARNNNLWLQRADKVINDFKL